MQLSTLDFFCNSQTISCQFPMNFSMCFLKILLALKHLFGSEGRLGPNLKIRSLSMYIIYQLTLIDSQYQVEYPRCFTLLTVTISVKKIENVNQMTKYNAESRLPGKFMTPNRYNLNWTHRYQICGQRTFRQMLCEPVSKYKLKTKFWTKFWRLKYPNFGVSFKQHLN